MLTPELPALVINPAGDVAFRAAVEDAFDPADPSAAGLQADLRKRYPKAVVRARDLIGERPPTWYVYREGHWVRGPRP